MSEANQGYRKKQAGLMLLVFACIGVAVWSGNAAISVGAILAACGLCFWAARLQPEPPKEEHHH
jgi:hypothetical protein